MHDEEEGEKEEEGEEGAERGADAEVFSLQGAIWVPELEV